MDIMPQMTLLAFHQHYHACMEGKNRRSIMLFHVVTAGDLTVDCQLVCRPTNYLKDIEKSSPCHASNADAHQAKVCLLLF